MPEANLMERFLANSNLGSGMAEVTVVPSATEKLWASIILGLLFALLSSAFSYGLTNKFGSKAGYPTWSAGAGPTMFGLVLHAVVFAIIVRMLMM